MKRYGDTKTHLTLTDKARSAYDEYSPLNIFEIETDDGFRYNISGCIEAEDLTEAETIEALENLVRSEAQNMIDAGLYDAAVQLMDDDLREEIHRELAPCSDEKFLAEYMRRHEEKYGEKFTV